jgi:hypothetical protein
MVDVNAAATLKKIQRLVRWHYQCIVLHDFLPTIVGEELVFYSSSFEEREIEFSGQAAASLLQVSEEAVYSGGVFRRTVP